MKRFIDVHTGEIMAGQGEVVLKSDAGNACLVIAAYDRIKKVGALAHALFLNGAAEHHHSPVIRDANAAIEEMINDMQMLGSEPQNIEVSVVAGENVHHPDHDPNYHKTIEHTLDILRNRHLRCLQNLKEDIGASHVELDVSSGEVNCK